MSSKLALETANAFRALENELPAKQVTPTSRNLVIDEARRLERLLAKRRRLKRELRALDRDIKHSRRMLKAFAGSEP